MNRYFPEDTWCGDQEFIFALQDNNPACGDHWAAYYDNNPPGYMPKLNPMDIDYDAICVRLAAFPK